VIRKADLGFTELFNNRFQFRLNLWNANSSVFHVNCQCSLHLLLFLNGLCAWPTNNQSHTPNKLTWPKNKQSREREQSKQISKKLAKTTHSYENIQLHEKIVDLISAWPEFKLPILNADHSLVRLTTVSKKTWLLRHASFSAYVE